MTETPSKILDRAMERAGYDPVKDVWDSVAVALAVLREDKANGGKGWEPKR